ncbi:MAG: YceI family protein [Cyclobacteriaceae bacterium]|nr:YceI family protein [Cyclobacteriaceae bacterium]
MKDITMFSILTAICLLIGTSNTSAQATLNVVTSDSKVMWTGTKVVGFHQGIVKIKEGKVTVKDNKLTGGHFVIDMTTITCTDIPESDPVPKRRLENHLKDADFFNVAKFPTARFEITEVRTHPDNPARYLVLGNLTIKETTKRWKIEVTPTTQTDNLFIGQADLRFDRQLFGVSYKGLKDELVHDEVRLNIIIKAKPI